MKVSAIIIFIFFLSSCLSKNEQTHSKAALPKKIITPTVSRDYSAEMNVKTLEAKEETIIVSYGAISCECAQWRIIDVINKQNVITDTEHIFLFRANTDLPKADTLWGGVTLPLVLRVTGRFYKETGYPPGYMPLKGDPKAARVFQYSKLMVIRTS